MPHAKPMPAVKSGPTGPSATRRLPIGAEIQSDGSAHFRVWAPKCERVEFVVIETEGASGRTVALQPERGGYYSGAAPGLPAGTLYSLRLDGGEQLLPDPASRFQPRGPDGPSQLVDPQRFRWTDAGWRGITPGGQVVYEMHIGTFTPEGTWKAAAAEFSELARTGMTVIEVMPVADFPGEFGWGYDGVCWFAPTRLYGPPDDFRRFVDHAHACGLGVILDVVYNHYGPVSNWLPQFSVDYTTDRYSNEWGAPVNFDGPNCGPVREFVAANVRHWIEEYHLDGLRFDATQAIHDESDPHILTELVQAAREAAEGRAVLILAENEPQNVRLLRPAKAGGHGMDAAWNDDFHHAAMVRLTGHSEAYYSDYTGAVEEFLATLKTGFLYQGQRSQWQKNPRGTPTTGLPATAFVNFLQNHDQVANSGRGERIDKLTSPGRLRAMTALWLLAPPTPMFFQGQEFAASSPFFYFADNTGEQAQRVAEGRKEFLKQFPTLATPEALAQFVDFADRSTFERCRLDFSEREANAEIYALHKDLLRLRREDAVFGAQRADRLDGAALSHDCLLVRYFGDDGDDRLVFANFGCDWKYSPAPQPLLAPPVGRSWQVLWSSNAVEYGGCGVPPLETDEGWRIPGEAAVVLQAIAANEPVRSDSRNVVE